MLAFGNRPSERTRKLHELIAVIASKKEEFRRAPRVGVARELLALKAELDAMPKSFE
jgi:hypothetical protein